MSADINIRNKKARHEYELLEKYEAGLQLKGTEIKSIRQGKASIKEAYCLFFKGELWVRSMHISEYTHGSVYNHEPRRDRKLLLRNQELRKLRAKSKDVGLTIVPLKLYINKRGYAKLQIALAKGKKLHDKRQTIKEQDANRQIDRAMKEKYG